jgi:hypothetical protein
VKISSDEAFLILHKWQVELTRVVFVGSRMPSNPLRGLISVVTREGVWNSSDKPGSIWGFLLTAKETSFLASKFETFEYLQPAELPSDIRIYFPPSASEHPVLALTQIQKLVNTAAQTDRDRLISIKEILFLAEDITSVENSTHLPTNLNSPSY